MKSYFYKEFYSIPVILVDLDEKSLTKKGLVRDEVKVTILCSDCKIEISKYGGNLNRYTKRGIFPKCRKCAGRANQQKGFEKYKSTLIKKYGVDNPSKVAEIKDRAVKTCIDKYGMPSINKARAAFTEKYKSDNPFKIKKFQDKAIETNLKKYGAINKNKYLSLHNSNTANDLELLNKIVSLLENDKTLSASSTKLQKELNIGPLVILRLLHKYHRTDLINYANSTSQYEMEIYDFLLSTGIAPADIIQNSRPKFLKGLELDIFLPKFKIAIEFNGLYWHSISRNKNPKYHMLKREYCNAENIHLIQILENEWRNNTEIVKSIIKSKLKITSNKIYARKLKIGFPNKKESISFLETNHIKGKSSGSSFIGLYDNNTLLFIIAYKMTGTELYLSRVCTKLDWIVIGGLSKLIHFLIKEKNPKSIKSYTDLRYFDGNSLVSLGFTRESTFLSWAWTDYKNLFNRRFCMATKFLTEKEHAEKLGLVKIYDAGQSLWIKNLN